MFPNFDDPYNPGGDPLVDTTPEDPNAWLYDPNIRPSKPYPVPGWDWHWNGKQWTGKKFDDTPLVRSDGNVNTGVTIGGNDGGGGGMTEAQGRAYDQQHGLVGGYMTPNGWVSGSPRSTGGGGGGNQFGYLTEPFTGKPPSWQTGPSFAPPTFTAPPPFSYKEFEVPTTDSIYADPSYKFRFGEGQQAVEQSAAGRGVLRTGGTLKDIANYGQNAASQEFSNIFKRGVDTHNLGLSQALGTYGTNYGISRDVFDRLYEGNKATFDAQQREHFVSQQRDLDNFLAEYDIFEKNRRRAGDYLFRSAELGNG